MPTPTVSPVLTVERVSCHPHRAPLLRPFVTAARRTEAVEYVVVEVRLSDGTVGQGSAAETVAVTGESAQTILDAVNGPLRHALEGATGTIPELSDLVAGSLDGATSAKSAVDVALYDAWGRSVETPLSTLLGGGTGSLENDMTVSLEDPATMARHATEAAAAGYRILKIKLGQDTDEDRRRLDAVLTAVPHARLRLDANQGWDVPGAVKVITTLESDGLPVDLVEQPVRAADLTGLAEVRRSVSTPVMADESVWSVTDAERIIDLGAADLLNIKLAKTGGVTEAVRIADLAHEAGLGCMVGSMMEPRISIAAAAHVAAAHPAVTMIDLDAPEWFTSGLPAGGFRQNGRMLELLGGPGLGLDLLHPDNDPDLP
jgi:L-alanine-DL-glutamate epimerase-like enolase superfamily enzyme